MSKRKREATTSEDSVVLPREAQSILDKMYRTPDIQGMIQVFSGNKAELAMALSGTTDKKSRAYKNARDNIGRYLRGTRKPDKGVQAKFDTLVTAKGEKNSFIQEPTSGVDVQISGTIGYDNNVRYRTIHFTLPADLAVSVLQRAVDNPHQGYADLMSVYFQAPLGSETPITVYGGDDLTIRFN